MRSLGAVVVLVQILIVQLQHLLMQSKVLHEVMLKLLVAVDVVDDFLAAVVVVAVVGRQHDKRLVITLL